MLSPYNPHTPAQRARSNAPIARSSLQNQMVSNFFQDDFFSDFHQEFQNFSNRMLSRFDGHFSNFGNFASPFSSMLKSFDEDFALMNNFSDCIHFLRNKQKNYSIKIFSAPKYGKK